MGSQAEREDLVQIFAQLQDDADEDLDPLIQRFLARMKGVHFDGDIELSRQYLINAALLNTHLSGFARITEAKGLIHSLLLVAKEREVLTEVMDKNAGELVKFSGEDIVARFDHPGDAMQCAVEAHSKLNAYNKTTDADHAVMMCVGLEFGEVLCLGEDVFGFAWDVCYAPGTSSRTARPARS